MKAICKTFGKYELKEYSGYLSSEFEGKQRYVILENGMIENDNHFSLTEAVFMFKNLIAKQQETDNLNLIGVKVSNLLGACKFFDVAEASIKITANETFLNGFKLSTFIYTVEGFNTWCYAVECYNMNHQS